MGNISSSDKKVKQLLISAKENPKDFVPTPSTISILEHAFDSKSGTRIATCCLLFEVVCYDSEMNRVSLAKIFLPRLFDIILSRQCAFDLRYRALRAVQIFSLNFAVAELDSFFLKNGMSALILMLNNESPDVCLTCCQIIGWVTDKSESLRICFAEHDGLSALDNALRNNLFPDVQKYAVLALTSLIFSSSIRKATTLYLPDLLKLLEQSRDTEMIRWICNGLATFCAHDKKTRILCQGSLGRLFELLDHQDEAVMRNCAIAIGNICENNKSGVHIFEELGGIERLKKIIKAQSQSPNRIKNLQSLITGMDMIHSSDEEAKTLVQANYQYSLRGKGKYAPPKTDKRGKYLQNYRQESIRSFSQSVLNLTELNILKMFEYETDPSEAKEKLLDSSQGKIPWSNINLEEKPFTFGSFSDIYRGSYLGRRIAAKKLIQFEDFAQPDNLIVREIQTLKSLRHPNILSFIGVSIFEKQIYIITELIEGGNLDEFMTKNNNFIDYLNILIDICRALTFLHSLKIMHRDIKPANILITSHDRRGIICDFGFSKLISNKTIAKTLKVGSFPWMSPECTMDLDYSFPSDVYSFGIIIFQSITKKEPPQRFPTNKFNFIIPEIQKTMLQKSKLLPNNQIPELTKIALTCLESQPHIRPLFSQLEDKLKELR